MRRSVTLASIVAFMAIFATSALAGPTWCEQDPILVVGNGNVVDVSTGWSGEDQPYATGVVFDLQVPSNLAAIAATPQGTVPIEARISYTLPPWDGTGPLPVVATVTVSGTTSFAVVTTVTRMSGEVLAVVAGRANAAHSVTFDASR